MIEATGAGVIGSLALAVWQPLNMTPIRTIEIAVPTHKIATVERWFQTRGYQTNNIDIRADAHDVVKSVRLMSYGTPGHRVSLQFKSTHVQRPQPSS